MPPTLKGTRKNPAELVQPKHARVAVKEEPIGDADVAKKRVRKMSTLSARIDVKKHNLTSKAQGTTVFVGAGGKQQ